MNKERAVQECDASKDEKRDAVGYIIDFATTSQGIASFLAMTALIGGCSIFTFAVSRLTY